MMISPVEKLRKFLALEQKRNFDNRAVTGGLEKFLPIWQRESATAGVPVELNEAVTVFLNTYAEKDTDERRTAISQIMEKLPVPEPRPERENSRSRHSGRPAGGENAGGPNAAGSAPEKPARRERSVPPRQEERLERKHRPEPLIDPEKPRREQKPAEETEETAPRPFTGKNM